MKGIALGLALVLGSTLAGLTAGELVLRALSPDQYFVFPPGLDRTFRPLPEVMPGISGDSRFLINDAGIRGQNLRDKITKDSRLDRHFLHVVKEHHRGARLGG